MHLFEVFTGNVRIYLCRGNVNMPEHYLDSPEIGAAFQEVAGKGVAQRVGGNVFGNTGLKAITFEKLPEALSTHGFPGSGHEKKRAGECF